METQLAVLQLQLQQNPNPRGIKLCIIDRMKDIEKLTFWKFTSEQDQLLRNFWKESVHCDHYLKVKLEDVVEGKSNEVELEIMSGVAQLGRVMQQPEPIVQEPEPEITTVAKRTRRNRSVIQSQPLPINDLVSSLSIQEYPLHNHEYFSVKSRKTVQTQQYIKELQKNYKQFKDQIQSRKERIEQKKKQTLEQRLNNENMLKQEQKRKKQKELQDYLQSMEQEKRKRAMEYRKFKEFLKDYKQSKPLHVLLQEEYKQKIELPMLQQQKNKMLLRQHPKKPTLEQLNEHDSRYMQMKREKQQNTSMIIKDQQVSVPFKSKFYRQASKSYHSTIEADQLEPDGYQRLAKVKKYSEYVNEELKPKIDERKKKQLQERIKQAELSMNYPLSARAQRQQDTIAKAQLIEDRKYTLDTGNKYMQLVHRKIKKQKIREKSVQSQKEESVDKSEAPRRINYLEQQKIMHQNKKGYLQNWQKDLNDLSLTDYDRKQRVLLKSRLMEEEALRKEKNLMNNDGQDHIERIEKKKQIDDTLLAAIKAKMAVLKN